MLHKGKRALDRCLIGAPLAIILLAVNYIVIYEKGHDNVAIWKM